MSIKYDYSLSYMNTIIESINKHGKYFIAINKPICDLKITNMQKESKLNNMEKHQFKPFDKVLVRDTNLELWRINVYSHLNDTNNHVCISGIWNYCIPYNEQTAHLVGTNEPYKEPEPKIWYVTDIEAKSTCTMTQKQFEHFTKEILDSNIDGIYQIGKIIKNN